MKQLLLAVTCLISMYSSGQDSTFVPRNEINIEHGYFNRGLIGVSYGRNFAHHESTYWSIAGSAGAGIQFVESSFLFDTYPIFFFGLTPSYQFGEKHNFLSLGMEFKNISSSDAYNGLGLGVFAGYSYNGSKGFLFKFRLGATAWSSDESNSYYSFLNQNAVVPMGGFSIGFSFGDPL